MPGRRRPSVCAVDGGARADRAKGGPQRGRLESHASPAAGAPGRMET